MDNNQPIQPRAALTLLDDGTAFGSVEVTALSGNRRRGTIHHGLLQTMFAPPTLTTAYLLATLDAPHRPVMLGMVAAMFLLCLSLVFANRSAAHKLRARLTTLSCVYYVLVAAALAHFDGGISSPMGPVVLFILPFVATTMPPRFVIGVSAIAFAGYWTVALTHEPMEVGRAAIYTFPFVALVAICSLHSRTIFKLGRRLAEACRTDKLSGCLNRRGFDESLLHALAVPGAREAGVALIAIDLDQFKLINDNFGHRTGDDAIAFTGEALRRTAGPGRLVARAGGDEFVIALFGDDQLNAGDLAEQARASLKPYISASVGIGRYPQDADQISGALRIADLEAYADKQERARTGEAGPIKPPPRPAPPKKQSSVKQRGRSIRATAATATFNNLVGLVYVMLVPGQNRELLITLLGGSLIVSLALLLGTSQITRTRHAGTVVNAIGMLLVANAAVATVADGGAASPIAVGLLLPMVTIALSAPMLITTRVVPVLAMTYLAIALSVGTPGFWYPTVHITAILAISFAAAIQTRASSAQRRALHDVGRVDTLTQCLTRSAFEYELEHRQTIKRGAGEGDNWFIVIDLDGFKAVNDRLGHASGDALLAWVAKRFRSELRADDLLARFGGDEFVVALSCYTEGDAQNVVARLADVIAERSGASFGLAIASDEPDGTEPSLNLADRRMYDQKLAHAAQPANLTS